MAVDRREADRHDPPMQTIPRRHDIPDDSWDPPTALVIPESIRREMIDHARAARPNESVGLLAALRDGRETVATAFFPGTNVDASPMRYTMDRTEVEFALGRISRGGWSLGAIVHSHPDDAAVPSGTDRREHRYPDALMGIISLATAPPDLRVWSLRPDNSAGGQRVVEIGVRTVARPTADEEYW